MKNKKTTAIVIAAILILTLTIGGILFISNNSNKTEQNKEENENIKLTWTGKYKNETGTINLYQQDEKIFFEVEIDYSSAEGTADIKGSKAKGSIFETYTFELDGNTLKFTTTDEALKEGTFTKESDYTTEEFFENHFGDPKYMNSNINGIYEKDDIKIRIFQIKENTVTLTITNKNSYFSKSAEVKNNKITLDEEFFDDIEKIEISLNDNQITVVASSTDTESILNNINGNFTKTSEYTAIQLIKEEAFGFYL